MQLAIDFGTSGTRAAVRIGSVVHEVRCGQSGEFGIPTSAYVEKTGEILAGEAARSRSQSRRAEPGRYFEGLQFKPQLGEPCPARTNWNCDWPELVAAVLTTIKRLAEKEINNGDPIDSVMLTVPALYVEGDRVWQVMEEAGRLAGFENIELMIEPDAAAAWFDSHLRQTDARLADGDLTLVYDLGAGTFDPALLRTRGNGYELLGASGGRNGVPCGGMYLDRTLRQDFANRYKKAFAHTQRETSSVSEEAARMFAELALREFLIHGVKHAFSDPAVSSVEHYEPVLKFDNYTLTRDEFNALASPLIDVTIDCCSSLLERAGAKWGELRRIVLVGGSCRLPLVRDKLRQAAGGAQVEILWANIGGRLINPELAVVCGAALLAKAGRSYKEKRESLLGIFERLGKIAAELKHGKTAVMLRDEAEYLRQGRLTLAICGEPKRGKSSLINELLGEADVCPADAPEATNVLTEIYWAPQEEIFVHFQADEGTAPPPLRINRSEIRRYVTEAANQGNKSRVERLRIGLNNPRLKDGLCLVDTPGVGGMFASHTAVTAMALPQADVIGFVGGASDPLLKPELAFCERFSKHTKTWLHIVTKKDTANNAETILADNLKKLRTVMPHIPIEGVTVSSFLEGEYRQTGVEELSQQGGFRRLESALWRLLSRRGNILLGRSAERILTAIEETRIPLETARDSFQSQSQAELDAIREELDAELKQLESMLGDSSTWIEILGTEFAQLQKTAAGWVTAAYLEVSEKIDSQLGSDIGEDAVTELAEALTLDCCEATTGVNDRIQDELNGIEARIRRLTKLDVKRERVRTLATRSVTLKAPPRRSYRSSSTYVPDTRTSFVSKLTSVVRGVWNSVVDYFRGPSNARVREEKGPSHTQLRHGLIVEAQRQVETVGKHAGTAVSKLITTAQAEMRKSLQDDLDRQHTARKASIAVLENSKTLTEAEGQMRLKPCVALLTELDQLEEEVQGIGSEL